MCGTEQRQCVAWMPLLKELHQTNICQGHDSRGSAGFQRFIPAKYCRRSAVAFSSSIGTVAVPDVPDSADVAAIPDGH